jgi:hypothetical protein
VAELAGTLPLVDTTRRYSGAGAWSDDGLSRTRLVPVLDENLVRQLDVGQVGYVYRGGVTFLQIKRLTGQQAAIGAGTGTVAFAAAEAVPGGAVRDGTAWGGGASGNGAGQWPTRPMPAVNPAAWVPADASAVLDEAFGERR